jgi:mannose-6-phosphate isomerase-like protein (cupin superfamily)
MSDIMVKRIDEFDSYQGPGGPPGQFVYAGKGLGVTAWGMNVLRLGPHWTGYPDHDHAKDGQEEVYVVLAGSATLESGGERWDLRPGTMARVGPERKRRILPGAEGVTLLAIGGTPGKAYEPRRG